MLFHVYWCNQELQWLVLQATTASQTTIKSYDNRRIADTVADLLNGDPDAHARAMLAISQPSRV